MRYLVLGVLACLCSGLVWAEVDETLGKSKATHINAQKLAKPSLKASPKLTPAELAKLATEKEIAQRLAAFFPTAAVATTAATATLSPAAAPLPNPALDAAAPSTMPEAQAAVSGDVHVGRMVCELGNAVSVTPDASRIGTYWVQMRQHRYHMTPVATSTGAVRLEDKQAGAMWLQLPHKSMLMNSKIGQRMADECQSAHQFDEASRMKSGPPSTLLDGPSLAKK